MSSDREELIGVVYFAWDETGHYATSTDRDEAIELLKESSDGVLVRVRKYAVPFFAPEIEEAGELDPAL